MNTLTLNKDAFFHSFMAGAKEVIRRKNNLNEINVFPVADGDTGSNLASMMQTILSESTLDASTETTLKSIADAALIGARGNSGIIFAQYINGLLDALKTHEEITLERFVESAEAAVPYAYEAIATPVEGTMITLMREFAQTLKQLAENVKDLGELLAKAFETLKTALHKTTEMLPSLKKAKVVDAGAKGFVHFIEGFTNHVRQSKLETEFDEELGASGDNDHDNFENETYRYCTEGLVQGENLDTNAVKASLMDLGDSLVVAGNDSTVRVHIHTDRPQDVFFRLREFGTIVEQKVDDMKKQYEIVHNRKHDIALVTDSIADLPKSFVDDHQIHVVPINLMIEDSNYYDKLTISSENFYRFMDELETYPSSAQPNQKQMENFLSFLSTYYPNILVLSVSAKMSGTYNVFQQAAKTLENTETNVRVLDTKQNSGAEGLLVMKAAELIDAGTSLEETAKEIETLIPKTKILVSVQTLKYMVRSGRLSKAGGAVGKIVNLKPVVSIDETGEGIIFEKSFRLKSATNKIARHVQSVHEKKGVERYAIVHANAQKRADEYEKLFTELLGRPPAYVMDISTVVAMNAGIGTVALAYIAK